MLFNSSFCGQFISMVNTLAVLDSSYILMLLTQDNTDLQSLVGNVVMDAATTPETPCLLS